VERGERRSLSTLEVFRVFFLAGLTFGGGLAIVAVLEREFVRDRQAISRDDFLTYYALARIVPTGTQTALAVSLGNYFAGLKGSVVAVAGLASPSLLTIMVLTVAFTQLQASSAIEILPQTVLPAAMALIAVGAISMGKDLVGRWRETLLAAAAFIAAWLLNLSPGIVLLAGGLVGIAIFWQNGKEAKK
jgi:chromate transporter